MLNASEIRLIGKVLWMEKSMLTKCGPVMLFRPILNGARFKQPVLPDGVFGLLAWSARVMRADE